MRNGWDNLQLDCFLCNQAQSPPLKPWRRIAATDGKGGKIGDLNITFAKRQGSIAYAKAVKDLLPDADLEAYRGKETEYWTVK